MHLCVFKTMNHSDHLGIFRTASTNGGHSLLFPRREKEWLGVENIFLAEKKSWWTMKTLDGLKAWRRTEEARVGHNEPVGVDGIPQGHTRGCLYMIAYNWVFILLRNAFVCAIVGMCFCTWLHICGCLYLIAYFKFVFWTCVLLTACCELQT